MFSAERTTEPCGAEVHGKDGGKAAGFYGERAPRSYDFPGLPSQYRPTGAEVSATRRFFLRPQLKGSTQAVDTADCRVAPTLEPPICVADRSPHSPPRSARRRQT